MFTVTCDLVHKLRIGIQKEEEEARCDFLEEEDAEQITHVCSGEK